MVICQNCHGGRWVIDDGRNVCATCGHPYEPAAVAAPSPAQDLALAEIGTSPLGLTVPTAPRRPVYRSARAWVVSGCTAAVAFTAVVALHSGTSHATTIVRHPSHARVRRAPAAAAAVRGHSSSAARR